MGWKTRGITIILVLFLVGIVISGLQEPCWSTATMPYDCKVVGGDDNCEDDCKQVCGEEYEFTEFFCMDCGGCLACACGCKLTGDD